MSEWIKTSERVPELGEGTYGREPRARVLAVFAGSTIVRELHYVNPIYNTRRKEPRWEYPHGPLCGAPQFWMPMPKGPLEYMLSES